jgi:hypothetical protein
MNNEIQLLSLALFLKVPQNGSAQSKMESAEQTVHLCSKDQELKQKVQMFYDVFARFSYDLQ